MTNPELNTANDLQKRLERLREYNRSLTDENHVLHKGMELLQEEVNRLTKLLERVLMK
jgi:FtsZ-binding cell division protein ZapB